MCFHPKLANNSFLLQHPIDGITSNHLKRIILDVMVSYGGLIQVLMVSKFITFGANEVNCVKTKVTI
jgi:hypothetical protein